MFRGGLWDAARASAKRLAGMLLWQGERVGGPKVGRSLVTGGREGPDSRAGPWASLRGSCPCLPVCSHQGPGAGTEAPASHVPSSPSRRPSTMALGVRGRLRHSQQPEPAPTALGLATRPRGSYRVPSTQHPAPRAQVKGGPHTLKSPTFPKPSGPGFQFHLLLHRLLSLEIQRHIQRERNQ